MITPGGCFRPLYLVHICIANEKRYVNENDQTHATCKALINILHFVIYILSRGNDVHGRLSNCRDL